MKIVNETGGTALPASDSTGGWELEESLDVEWAHAMAPGANIILVEASSTSYSDLFAGVGYAATQANVVSMSWGGGEFSGENSYDSAYFSHPGVAYVASSGDSGAPASYPSASPNVLSVGGTTLILGSGNVWSSETGWSDSGGGPSSYESQPSYQTGVVKQTTLARATPDVAYDANPSTGVAVYDSVPYDGSTLGWVQVGGTSNGAPQWSALLALADQARAANNESALNTTSPTQVQTLLYSNSNDFHDITSGTSTGSPSYSAGTGYDYVTGMGSPMANLVVSSLVGAPAAPHDTLSVTAVAPETAGTSFTVTVTAKTSSGATDTSYTGTVHFTSSDTLAVLPANFTFPASDDGTARFTVTLKTAGSQSITVADTANPAITGTLSGILVNPAAASKFVLSGLSSGATVGVAQSLTVTAEDPYGNVATGYAGTMAITSTDSAATLPGSYTFSSTNAGVHTFSLTFNSVGTQSVTATDSAHGITATQSGISVVAAPTTVDSIWPSTYIATSYWYSEGSYELGVKFESTEPGKIIGIRFYEQSYTYVAGQTNVGHLWTSSGTMLGSATFTNETSSGWQQADFSSPVAIQANTLYIASFSTSGGEFGVTPYYFRRGGVIDGPLEALPNSSTGGNGVYSTTPGTFPIISGQGMNFWADVAFAPSSGSGGSPPALAPRKGPFVALGGLQSAISAVPSSVESSIRMGVLMPSSAPTTTPGQSVGSRPNRPLTPASSGVYRGLITQAATLASWVKKSGLLGDQR